MRPFFQTEWQGIPFKDVAALSTKRVAGPQFYQAFYRELFRRFKGYDELDSGWRTNKAEIAAWLRERVAAGSRVLSIGAGIGYIEYCLHANQQARLELHVEDVAPDALQWLQRELPAGRVHVLNGVNSTADATGGYDLIYLSAVDYAMQDPELIAMLGRLKTRLRPGGACVLISASFLEEHDVRATESLKTLAKAALEKLGLYDRGQFWGWKRTRAEYRDLMRSAGYSSMQDGFIKTVHQSTYFIEARP